MRKPATVIAWHRAGFRAYWRWKSQSRCGRPQVSPEVRALIGEMSIANLPWGAPRIHGELLKLGINVGQTTVAKYMPEKDCRPRPGWKTFLRNHGIVAMDMFVVPTLSFRVLYGLLILQHARRELLWLAVTSHPSAQWIAQQLIETYGWNEPLRYLIRHRDSAYGEAFIHSYQRYTTMNASVFAQGRIRAAGGGGSWPRAFAADLGRATPSICSSLSFRQGQVSKCFKNGSQTAINLQNRHVRRAEAKTPGRGSRCGGVIFGTWERATGHAS